MDAIAGAVIGLAWLSDNFPDSTYLNQNAKHKSCPIDPNKPANEVLPGKLKREFPGEHLDKSLNMIKDALKIADGTEKRSLQKAKKILEQIDRLMGK